MHQAPTNPGRHRLDGRPATRPAPVMAARRRPEAPSPRSRPPSRAAPRPPTPTRATLAPPARGQLPTRRERGGAPGKGDRGSASVLTIAIGLTVLLLAVGVAAVAAAMIARHQAQAAADFAALAAAPHALAGQEFACAFALHIAEANGGRLTKCAVDGFDAVTAVSMSVDIPFPGLGGRTAEATSRAGPAEPGGTPQA